MSYLDRSLCGSGVTVQTESPYLLYYIFYFLNLTQQAQHSVSVSEVSSLVTILEAVVPTNGNFVSPLD